MAIEMTKVNEQRRVYVFIREGRKHQVAIDNVVEFYNSNTTHRLKDKDGSLHIIPKDFVQIIIDGAGEFTL